MSQSSPRFDPMQILDAEWRTRVWKRWLKSRWMGLDDVAPPAPEPTASGTGEVAPTMPPPPRESGPQALTAPPVSTAQALPPVAQASEARRRELLAHFDRITDRLGGLEDQLESLTKRLALSTIHQRRHDQRLGERLDSSGEMMERQTLALEALQLTMQRVDQRLERLERRVREPAAQGELPVAEKLADLRFKSHITLRPDYEDYADLEASLAEENLGVTAASSLEPNDAIEPQPHSGPSIHGSLSEMSLGTVLAMLELERRTGLLQVSSEEGNTVTATLRQGAFVGARRHEVETCPVEVVREALRYKNGYFLFRQSTRVEAAAGPARSVGSVLLEASSRNDEAARAS